MMAQAIATRGYGCPQLATAIATRGLVCVGFDISRIHHGFVELAPYRARVAARYEAVVVAMHAARARPVAYRGAADAAYHGIARGVYEGDVASSAAGLASTEPHAGASMSAGRSEGTVTYTGDTDVDDYAGTIENL